MKLWCRFGHLQGSPHVYATWSNQIKAFIIACPLEPGHLTESPVYSIIWFARGQLPVKQCIELIKHEHHADNVWELIRPLKMMVKDVAKKVVWSNKGQRADYASCGDIAEPPNKCYPSLLYYPHTNHQSQWLILIGTLHLHCEQ